MPNRKTTVRPGAALSGRALPRPGRGNNRGVTLGKTASLGGLGSSLAASGGFGTRPVKPGAALSGRTATATKGTPSNVRPRPGRGVNPRLALSGTKYYEAKDRLEALRKQVRDKP